MANPSITLEEIITFLLEAPMFGDLDASELSQIVHIMQVLRLREGQVVFTEGDVGDAWYVLFDGEVEVVKEGGDDQGVLLTLGARTCFGEMAILDGSPRSASVRAKSDATVFKFPRADFALLLAEENLAAYKLVHQMALVLVARQRDTTTRLVSLMKQHQNVQPTVQPIVTESSVTE